MAQRHNQLTDQFPAFNTGNNITNIVKMQETLRPYLNYDSSIIELMICVAQKMRQACQAKLSMAIDMKLIQKLQKLDAIIKAMQEYKHTLPAQVTA